VSVIGCYSNEKKGGYYNDGIRRNRPKKLAEVQQVSQYMKGII